MPNTYATWDPSYKGSNISVDTGNLHAYTEILAGGMIRATISKTSGKYYWEVTVQVSPQSVSVGIVDNNVAASGNCNLNPNGWMWLTDTAGSAAKWHNGASASYGSNYATNDVIGIALDIDAGKLWWAKNGTWQASGDPANGSNPAYTGITGTLFPALQMHGNGAGSPSGGTANFGATAFAQSVPAGFTAGWYTGGAFFTPSPLTGLGAGGALITNRLQ